MEWRVREWAGPSIINLSITFVTTIYLVVRHSYDILGVHVMSCHHKIPLNSRCWMTNIAAPYKTLFIILEILNFLNYSYFAKIMIRKPKT